MSRVPAPEPYRNRLVLAEGSAVREYRNTQFLGAGGMGVVYRAWHGEQAVVLKEAPGDQPTAVLSLTQERALLERLHHPGIVRFHQLFEENGYYYLVLEFIEGIPLSRLKEPASEAQVRDWGAQLCDILGYLHEQDPPIIYRDLKADNVLLSGDRIRLIDFGIARLYKGGRDSDTELMGTMQTASPEHFGGSETDARSDVYTLGALLYQLLAGSAGRRGLFDFQPICELRHDVSASLQAVLEKCTALEPDQRFQSMAELRHALVAEPTVAPPEVRKLPANLPAEPRPARTRPGWVGVALIVGLFGLGFLATRVRSGAPAGPKSMGSPREDTGLHGPLFGVGEDGADSIVFLGEDVGLFRVTGAVDLPARQRAEQVSERLNRLYHSRCMVCGEMKLRADDFLIGRYSDPRQKLEEVVVFYAHVDDGRVVDGPYLVATADKKSAARLDSTPRFAAAHWRNLLRDVVMLSRGEAPDHSALGGELQSVLLETRASLKGGEAEDWLTAVLARLTSAQARQLREAYQKVPEDLVVQSDSFPAMPNYEPLRN